MFKERDTVKKRTDSKKALSAEYAWDTGEPESGLCSELEQDVNKSAGAGGVDVF